MAAAAAVVAAGLRCAAPGFLQAGNNQVQPQDASRRRLLASAVGALASTFTLQDSTSWEANAEMERRKVAYPPIDRRNKNRCQWQSSAMGQSNAARDKLFDLRECDMKGSSAADKDIAGVLMNTGDFSNVDFTNTVMSKAVAEKANLEGANFRNAVADRVSFAGSNLRNANFNNAVLTGAKFADADIEGADFSDSYIDQYGVRPLCQNPTMKGTNPKTGADTYESAGCYNQGLAR